MKNIVTSFLLGIVFVLISLVYITVDYSNYYINNERTFRVNENYFFSNKTMHGTGNCDVICYSYRGYPLKMKMGGPVIHDDMVWKEKNVIKNFIFYFSVSLFTLLVSDSYLYYRKKK